MGIFLSPGQLCCGQTQSACSANIVSLEGRICSGEQRVLGVFQMVASLIFHTDVERLFLDLHRDNVVGLLKVNH